MTLPRRKYRQCVYMLMIAAVILFDSYVRDVGFVGFLVGFLGLTLLYFDRDWRKGFFSSPFDRDEWFGR